MEFTPGRRSSAANWDGLAELVLESKNMIRMMMMTTIMIMVIMMIRMMMMMLSSRWLRVMSRNQK